MNILVCVDGSEQSYEAVKKAGELAKNAGSKEISVICVREPSEYTPVFAESDGQLRKRFEARKEEATKKVFSEVEIILNDIGVKCNKMIEDGHPVSKINEVCSKENFDLVVIGNRGLGRLRSMLLGSVSYGVAQEIKTDVLIVKNKRS